MRMLACIKILTITLLMGAICMVHVPVVDAADDLAALENVWETDVFDASNWTAESLQQLFAENGFTLSTSEAQHIIDLETAGLIAESREYTMRLFGIGVFSVANSFMNPVSSSSVTSRLVFNEIVMPGVQTRSSKKKEDAQKAQGKTRIFGGKVRYEDLDVDRNDGDLVGFNLGIAQDFDNFTVGLILPYDNIDFDDLFNVDRYGLVLFGQYNIDLTPDVTIAGTANLNYTYTDVDFDSGESDRFNTAGGGLSASVTLDKDIVVTSAAISYQYNEDDSNVKDDHQHLVKMGANAGYRIGDNHVITIFGVWNADITNYSYEPVDDDYFDLGAELTTNFSETWGLTVGYKTVVDLEAFDSDMYYLGSILRF